MLSAENLNNDHAEASESFMAGLGKKLPYGKIVENLAKMMPGYSALSEDAQGNFAETVLSGDLSRHLSANKAEFQAFELERIKGSINQAEMNASSM